MVEAISKFVDTKKNFNLNIQWKIVLVGVILIAVFVTLILAYIIPGMEKALYNEKKLETKEQVQVVWNILSGCHELEESGEYTREEAQELAIHMVENIRYGDNLDNYFWLQDFTPNMVMHPVNTELNGTDLSNTIDSKGNYLYREFASICKSQGEGYNTYFREYGGDASRYEEKTSYVKAFEPWGWITGTGIFTVDVEETVAQQRKAVILISAGIAILGVICLFLFAGMISKNIKKVAAVADKLAIGDANQEINIKSGDETGDMGRSLGRVVDYLKEMSAVAENIADGDLTITVEAKSEKDTLGNAFNKMIANLRQLVGQVQDNAETIASASQQLSTAAEQSGSATQQIASVSQQVSKGVEEQAGGLKNTNSILDQLAQAIDLVAKGSQEQAKASTESISIVQQVSSAADETAKNAHEAASVASQAAEVAKEGATTVEKTIDGMGKINASMAEVSEKIMQLGKHSEEIGGMIAVIDDIAAQTNLLALNAAIEAARAGEQGRGFAVVADEVKKLAERTAKETQEIASLVGTVQKGVTESIKAANDGSKLAEEGSVLANESGNALNQIMEAVKGMTSQIEQISAAAEEMSTSSNEMVNVVDNVGKVSEQNSAATEQMAANKAQLSESANGLVTIGENNSAAAQEMSASAEEMSAQVEEVVASSQSLASMAQELNEAIAIFRINKSNGSNGNGKQTKVNILRTTTEKNEDHLEVPVLS